MPTSALKAQPKQNLRCTAHPPRRLSHWKSLAGVRGSPLAVSALVPYHRADPRVVEQRRDLLVPPGPRPLRVFMEEVPPALQLEAVDLTGEVQQSPRLGIPPGALLLRHLGHVQGHQGAPPCTRRTPHDQPWSLRPEAVSAALPVSGLQEVVLLAVLVGLQVEGRTCTQARERRPWPASRPLGLAQHLSNPGRAVELCHLALRRPWGTSTDYEQVPHSPRLLRHRCRHARQ